MTTDSREAAPRIWLVVTFALTAQLTSPATVRELRDRLIELLPGQLGAPAAVDRLVAAGSAAGRSR